MSDPKVEGLDKQLKETGFLKGHQNWVTSIKAGSEPDGSGDTREFLVSGSRDHSLIQWELNDISGDDDSNVAGIPKKVMTGHSHFVSDIDISHDSRYCLSASWDGTLRLWNLKTAETRKTFIGHDKDVLTAAFSPDNRQICSGSIDKGLKIWNIHGVCKFTVEQNQHTDWVSCVRYHDDAKKPIVISASWDRTVKVWDNATMTLMHTFVGHKAQINCLEIAVGAPFVASGGRDGMVNVWHYIEGRHLDEIDAESPVNSVLFVPDTVSLIIGTEDGIRVYHLPSKTFVDKFTATDLDGKRRVSAKIGCTSLCLSKQNHSIIYAGFTDGYIRRLEIVNATSD